MKENVLRWIGGKHTLAEFIIKRMAPHNEYVEVFIGAANIFLQKELAKINVINDLNGNLVNMYKVIMHDIKKELLKWHLKHAPYSRELFNYFKDMYYKDMSFIMQNDVYRAFIFIYLNRVGFNGMFQTYSRRDDASVLYDLDEIIDKICAKIQAGKTVIEKLPFDELLQKTENGRKTLLYDREKVLIYLDPPYWVTTLIEGSKYYEKVMEQSEHKLLRDILFSHKRAKWLLSYDDHPEVRAMYGLPLNSDSEILHSETKGIQALFTPETHQSSASTSDEQIFKRELLIANYSLENINTLFE